MSFLNKRVEDSIKQAKLLAQMSELSYRALNGTRQTRSNFINNDLKEQADTDKPAVGSLTSEMIAQYKREEEEKNKYVDPGGNEFLYAPTGITPKISTSTLTDVSSLGAPATITDVEKEQSNYATILQDLNDKKQELAEKKREYKNKNKEVAEKQAHLKFLEEQFNEAKSDKTKLLLEATAIRKRLATLMAITKPTPEEKEEIKQLKDDITEAKKILTEIDTNLSDISTEHGTIRTEGATLVSERNVINGEIKDIINFDIPLLEKDLEKSKKLIETYQDNIKENEIIERDTERDNKQQIKAYQDTFNIMNKNRYQVTQDPTETDADFIKRIESLEKLAFDPTIFKDRATTEGNSKFMKNLKDITRDEVKISAIVKSFSLPEEVFLINSNWPIISNRLKSVFGFDNPAISTSEYKSEIEKTLDTVQTGKTTNITVVAPTPGTSTSTSATAPTGVTLANLDHTDGTLSDFAIGIENNSLFIRNIAENKAIYIKIGTKSGLKYILFSNSTSSENSFRAFKFVGNDSFSFKKMLSTLKLDEKLNKDIKVALFGTNKVKEDLYDFLQTTYKLTSEVAKPFVESGKVIMGYGLKTESIPDICHFGKNIILLKKLYYNNILSVKNKKMHAIEYFTNVKVSDNFVDVILQMCKNSKPNINNLTPDEKQLLDTLLHVCGIKSSANSSKKDDVVNELKNKFKLAEGQLRAGNNNPLIIKELKDILKKLTLYNVVTLKNSKDYLKQF